MVPQKSEHVTTLSFPKGKYANDIYFICGYINTSESMIRKCHNHRLHRGSYLSAHVLWNLLNELMKTNKMRSLTSILSLFRNEFDKFNNSGARILDSIYHMTLT